MTWVAGSRATGSWPTDAALIKKLGLQGKKQREPSGEHARPRPNAPPP